jgi:hypothetical protein
VNRRLRNRVLVLASHHRRQRNHPGDHVVAVQTDTPTKLPAPSRKKGNSAAVTRRGDEKSEPLLVSVMTGRTGEFAGGNQSVLCMGRRG